ncbi:hypothetical protein ZTR_01871 [Talaromyces verruculosus]|nr:hypothetical protein ZTR_01871 [Talaromyces verruculosus]
MTSQDNMEAIDLLLNYDVSRFYIDFQSPALQATMLPPDQVTPPMTGLGDSIEDYLGLDGTLYSSQASTSIHSQGQLTPPLSISDLDGYTEYGGTTLECTHPVGSTSNNRKVSL